MKKTTVWHSIKIPIYHGKLWIKFSNDFIKDAKKIGVDLQPNANEFLGLAFRKKQSGAGAYCIMIGRNTPDIIAHECLHVVNYIFHDRSISINTENDEAQCYLLSWVVTQVELVNQKK